VASHDNTPELLPAAWNGDDRPYIQPDPGRPRRYWLHILLLLLTLCTTTVVGTRLVSNFQANRPAFDLERDMLAYLDYLTHPHLLLAGLPFSLTLLTVLLCHEMGHYVACMHYNVDASLPYFLPAPTLIGTFGAFIRIRSPIFSKKILFDVGIAGPIAGFVMLLPPLAIGLAYSKVIPGIAERGDLAFGTPLLLKLLEMAVFPGAAATDIYLHPVARAAWVGIFATALNLLPIGQLDGGHVLYAYVGERHRRLSLIFALVLIPIGLKFWSGWLLWSAFFLLFGLRHPSVYDPEKLDPARRRLTVLAIVMLILSFTLAPLKTL
jgi:membrane-associated protease RseP (regulator of RpoE activity)